MTEVHFAGIDRFNRPVFTDRYLNYYGSTGILFGCNATEEYVLAQVKEKDLCYFGRHFGCEPEGDPVTNITITPNKKG